jgi:hypothetical protein
MDAGQEYVEEEEELSCRQQQALVCKSPGIMIRANQNVLFPSPPHLALLF